MKGIIEGFYGRSWSWQDREVYASFLSDIGYNTYIYAPKSDRCLRNDWKSCWSPAERAALMRLSSKCRESGIRFGVGFSPLGLSEDIDGQLDDLVAALERLVTVGVDVFCLLFDDMRGDDPQLAEKQLRIASVVESVLDDAVELVICPSYYSDDPVLDEVFGKRPASYLSSLGQGLSQRWSIFWTGQQVVTLEYDRRQLQSVAETLCRKPLLWDNYPVNDGRKLWPFIHLLPKPRLGLDDCVRGYLHNPMNQAWCSMIVIARMAGFANVDTLLGVPGDTWQVVLDHQELFQHDGLDRMTTQTKTQLLQCRALDKHAVGKEIKAWLEGEFEFDPACLT